MSTSRTKWFSCPHAEGPSSLLPPLIACVLTHVPPSSFTPPLPPPRLEVGPHSTTPPAFHPCAAHTCLLTHVPPLPSFPPSLPPARLSVGPHSTTHHSVSSRPHATCTSRYEGLVHINQHTHTPQGLDICDMCQMPPALLRVQLFAMPHQQAACNSQSQSTCNSVATVTGQNTLRLPRP